MKSKYEVLKRAGSQKLQNASKSLSISWLRISEIDTDCAKDQSTNYQSFFSNTKFSKTMTPEQFNQVVEAILEGKYSWACVLILRFAGYNPLHYVPYRTYNRLLKENCQTGSSSRSTGDSFNKNKQRDATQSDAASSQKLVESAK